MFFFKERERERERESSNDGGGGDGGGGGGVTYPVLAAWIMKPHLMLWRDTQPCSLAPYAESKG